MSGNIYFLTNSDARALKIGYSTNIRHRMVSHACSSPSDQTLYAVVPGTQKQENALHRALQSRRLNGEWFRWDLITHELIERARAGVPIEELIDFATPDKLFARLYPDSEPTRATGRRNRSGVINATGKTFKQMEEQRA